MLANPTLTDQYQCNVHEMHAEDHPEIQSTPSLEAPNPIQQLQRFYSPVTTIDGPRNCLLVTNHNPNGNARAQATIEAPKSVRREAMK